MNTTTKIYICRYRSGDTLGPNTANMQGYYTKNAPLCLIAESLCEEFCELYANVADPLESE